MSTLNMKKLIISIKHGASVHEAMRQFGFDDQEKFFQEIMKKATNKGNDFIHQLKQNEKRVKKLKMDNEKDNITLFTPIENDSSVTDVEIEMECSDVEQTNETEPIKTPDEERISKLELLESDERDLSDSLYGLEVKHKRLVSERKEIANSLQAARNDLQKLLEKVAAAEETVTAKLERYSSILNEMKELDLEMREYRQTLDDIRGMIEELKQVVFFISSSKIEVENAEISVPNPDEVSTLFSELLVREEAEELTVREIKTVAQLLIVSREFKHYEVVFENPKMEVLFNQVKEV